MAWYRAEFTVPVTAERAFDYLAAFHNVRHWDPSVVRADAAGSGFDVDVNFGGRVSTLHYDVVERDAPHRLMLRASNAFLTSTDSITFVPLGNATRVTYHADLSLHGPLRVFDRMLQQRFRPLAVAAIAGLDRELRSLEVSIQAGTPDNAVELADVAA
jgi:carbon monoxide dehydrogenase subunit G